LSERAPEDEEQSNCATKERKKKNLVMGPKGVPDTKTDRPSVITSTQFNSLNYLIAFPNIRFESKNLSTDL
jgi:hypothetical protein